QVEGVDVDQSDEEWFADVNGHFFFFQAEDGIRDFHVTGVQTCALPISPTSNADPNRKYSVSANSTERPVFAAPSNSASSARGCRSEERRVGKECRSRRSADEVIRRGAI